MAAVLLAYRHMRSELYQGLEERVLVLAAGAGEAESIGIALSASGMTTLFCPDLARLCAEMTHGAGCALIADEALTDPGLRKLIEVIDGQPDWSDIPLLIITATTARNRSDTRLSQLLLRLGNAVLMDRPLRPDTLVSAVRIALRGRRRQYQIRHHLAERDAASKRQRFLIDFNDALRKPRDPAAITATAAAAIGRHIGVPCVSFCQVDANGEALSVVGDYADGSLPCTSITRLPTLGEQIARSLRAGDKAIVDDVRADDRIEPEEARTLCEFGGRAFLAAPLMRGGHLAAVLLLADARARQWSRQDALLLDRLAERTWLAVERIQAERALRESEENLRLALSMGPMLVFKQDAALRYTWAAGLNKPILGLTDEQFLAPEYAGPLTAIKRTVLESGVPAREEVAVKFDYKGAVRFYDLILEPIHEGPHVTGLRGAAIDITHQHRTRLALEQALLAKSRFLAAASHDLRQPFQAMRLFHHILMNQLTDPHALKIGESLLAAMEAGEGLLHALLDVSTLDAGTVQPSFSDVEVADLLSRLVVEFRPLAADKGLGLRAHIRSAVVRSDPALLERIFRNLLSNAVRYTHEGGILAAVRCHRGRVKVEIWDTGQGIRPEEMQAIFEEFYQVGNAERDRRQGLGLGLPIVDRLARLLGVDIIARSRVGRGSVFGISLPLSVQPDATKRTSWRPETLHGARVLVIADDPVQLHAMTQVLEDFGCSVAAASDEEEALDHAKRHPLPQVVLSDLRLRGSRTGYQAVDRIRRFARSRIPAIILTGETSPAHLAPGDRPGYRVLHKPIDPTNVARAIADMIEQAP